MVDESTTFGDALSSFAARRAFPFPPVAGATRDVGGRGGKARVKDVAAVASRSHTPPRYTQRQAHMHMHIRHRHTRGRHGTAPMAAAEAGEPSIDSKASGL